MSRLPLSKIIVLEGPDNTGKTTLAKRLVSEHDYRYAHFGPPTPQENLLVTYGQEIQAARLRPRPTVFDRLHLGELVYGSILRGGSKLVGRGHWLLDLLLKASGADVHLCMDRFPAPEHKPDHGYTTQQIERVWHGYQNLGTVYHCIMDMKNIEFVRPLDRPTLPPHTIGIPWHARYLFIGERANQELDLPFFALNASSGFLHDCLLEAGYLPQEMAFMNILDRTGRVNSILEAAKAMPKFVCAVALGGEARKKLDETPLPSAHLMHPQFVKRFRNSKTDQYVRQLRMIREGKRDED